jgi:hypothetical protein
VELCAALKYLRRSFQCFSLKTAPQVFGVQYRKRAILAHNSSRPATLNDLAAVIFFACVLLVVVPATFAFWLARKNTSAQNPYRALVIAVSVALGLIVGGLAVVATFFESTWSPAPRVELVLPAQFDHDWVILLETPSATRTLAWSGVEAPFSGKKTVVEVPASGVVRVQSLAVVAGGNVDARTREGAQSDGSASGPGPALLGANSYIALSLPHTNASARNAGSPPFGDTAAFAAYISGREASAAVGTKK